jgi:calcium/calmodulin-dependent protein kinase I
MEAIIAGDYAFEPVEYWSNVSDTARSFVTECLTIDPANRPTAEMALAHKWVRGGFLCKFIQSAEVLLHSQLASEEPHFVPDPDKEGGPTDLLPHVRKAFDAKKTCM